MRNVKVSISGEVLKPGTFNLNGMSDLLDALTLAGGVKKSGTLRNIKIIKNDKISTVDLYKSFLYR